MEKTYECSADCGRKYIATEARAQKWLCGCGVGKIVASWWGKNEEQEKISREQSLGGSAPEEKILGGSA